MSTQLGWHAWKQKYPRQDAILARVLYIVKSYCIAIFKTKYRQLNRTWSQPVPGRVVDLDLLSMFLKVLASMIFAKNLIRSHFLFCVYNLQ